MLTILWDNDGVLVDTEGLYVGPYTVCNLNGQMLNLVGHDDVAAQLASLGPDAMTQPYPADGIRTALAATTLPSSEALLDQSVLAGVGNIAKSEIWFQTGIDPRVPANEVTGATLDRLLESRVSLATVLQLSITWMNWGRP